MDSGRHSEISPGSALSKCYEFHSDLPAMVLPAKTYNFPAPSETKPILLLAAGTGPCVLDERSVQAELAGSKRCRSFRNPEK